MPDIQITVSPAVMGLIAPGRTGPRPLCHRPTPSSARQPASGWCGRRRWTPGPPIEASRHELASQSDGLGLRGVLGRENTSLTEELTAELAGILSWSLDGLGRLTRQGKFTEPTSLHRLHLGVTGFRLPGLLRSYATAARSASVRRSRLRTFSAIGACGARTTDTSRGRFRPSDVICEQ